MSSESTRDHAGSNPYVESFLDALDRMRKRRLVDPDRLAERARTLLVERLGQHHYSPEVVFTHGSPALLAEHTHCFDGFALLFSLSLGTAVAVRPSPHDRSRLVFEESGRICSFDPVGGSNGGPFDGVSAREHAASAVIASLTPSPTSWERAASAVIASLTPHSIPVDVAVVSTIPPSLPDAYVASLGMATARACGVVFGSPESSRLVYARVYAAIEAGLGRPFGVAFLIAAEEGRPERYTLVDAGLHEFLLLEAPTGEELGWGLVDVGNHAAPEVDFYTKRKEMAAEATAVLRKRKFRSMTSLRDLEHRDLKSALEVAPARLRPVIRYLVSENRRVQKLVVAIRRRDWQMFGALLLMSYASMQKDGGGTAAVADVVVRETEAMSMEGMYGAFMGSRSGGVVVVGRPFVIPRFLDRVCAVLKEEQGIDARALLL